jgi:hypothetical protein
MRQQFAINELCILDSDYIERVVDNKLNPHAGTNGETMGEQVKMVRTIPQSTARLMALRTRLRQLNSSRTLGDSNDMLEITRIILTQIVDLERILRVRATALQHVAPA